jgi:tetratricopeptide (TPR) repeat protein
MPKKKQSGKRSKRTAPSTPPTAIDPRAMEKATADLTRLLSSREFGSIDEMNAFLRQMMDTGTPVGAPASTPLEQAQDLMYEAWNATGRQRVQLAHKALALSPDCADAYVLLAEETAKTPQQARELYQQGVAAAERALGPEIFEEGVGHFWGIVETRPYMRAREGLAHVLWLTGEHRTAIDHLKAMLHLNPGDNQGLRYVLAQWLLQAGADEEMDKLLAQYPDDAAATWAYTRALWIFRQQGATEEANAALADALSTNQFVPAYLLGRKRLPQRLPAFVGLGDENEAIEYAAHGIDGWRRISGALTWLTSMMESSGI